MLKRATMLALVLSVSAFAEEGSKAPKKIAKLSEVQSFTGKVVGKGVRMRNQADVESHIITELAKDELVVVTGEKNDFYAVETPAETKAYIFRSFVLDGVVEGDRVNVRLSPDRDAPVIGHLNTGARVEGKVCENNNKWLEITPPTSTRFYVAKEFIEYAGNPEMKHLHDKRKATVAGLMESASLLVQAEMRKAFNEIDIKRLSHNFDVIISDYTDFPKQVDEAKGALSELKENYLQRKIAYLESRAAQMGNGGSVERHEVAEVDYSGEEHVSATDRMRVWEPIEESLFLTWSAMHHAKSMDDFYEEGRLKSATVTGILEAYTEPVKNKPGDFVLKENDATVGYIYSTQVNLHELIGKQVSLIVNERPNNHFAYPAFYAIDVE